MKISQDTLREANNRGIIAGPDELPKNFLKRLHQRKREKRWTVPCMDLTLDWAEVVYGGTSFFSAAHILMNPTDGEATIHVNRKSYIPLSEQINHEIVHASRICFEEGRFEELLAFTVSASSFRRFWGPLFPNPLDPLWVISLSLVHFIGSLLFNYFFSLVPLISFLFFRLFKLLRNQAIFRKGLKKLERIFEENSLAVICRMTDSEICMIAKESNAAIQSYIVKNHSLRWKQIKACYPLKSKDRF